MSLILHSFVCLQAIRSLRNAIPGCRTSSWRWLAASKRGPANSLRRPPWIWLFSFPFSWWPRLSAVYISMDKDIAFPICQYAERNRKYHMQRYRPGARSEPNQTFPETLWGQTWTDIPDLNNCSIPSNKEHGAHCTSIIYRKIDWYFGDFIIINALRVNAE